MRSVTIANRNFNQLTNLLTRHQGPDLQNILRQTYDYLTIMPTLRSTYDGRLIYQTSYEERRANSYLRFSCKIVR